MSFSAAKLSSNFRNRHFTIALIPVFICFHVALLAAALAGVNLQAPSATEKAVSNPAAAPARNPATPVVEPKP